MNSKERIWAALNNEQPDKVPIFELYINESSIGKLAKFLRVEDVEVKTQRDRLGEESFEILDLYCLVIKKLELDATCTNFSTGIKNINKNYIQDKFGTVYRLSEHGEPMPVEAAIKDYFDLKGFDMVSRLELKDFERVQYVIDNVGTNKSHFIMVTDPFKLSWRLRGGMQNLLIDYALNPQLVHGLARITTDFAIAAIDIAVGIAADVIVVPGDLAGEESTMISPQHYREYLKPYHEEMVVHAHQKGVKIIKHSDGNVWSILDDFVEVGFDGFHPVQPQSMDIRKVKEYLTGKACVLGNIDCRNLLPFGTEKEVEDTVRETIEKVAPGGGYIISSSNSIHPHCKPENYIAMVKATHKYGNYSRM